MYESNVSRMSQTFCASITPHSRYIMFEYLLRNMQDSNLHSSTTLFLNGGRPGTPTLNTFSRTTCFQDKLLMQPDALHYYVFPQVFEPRLCGPKPRVLPIRRGENLWPIRQRTFVLFFELLAGIKPTLFLITSEVHHHLCVRSIFILR